MPQIYSFIFFLFFRCFNFTFKLFGVYAMWLVVVIIITLPGLLGAHTYTLTPVHRVAFLDFFIGKHTQTCARTIERRFICKFSCFGWRTMELRIVIINIISNNMIFILVVSFDVLCFFLKIAKCNLMRM